MTSKICLLTSKNAPPAQVWRQKLVFTKLSCGSSGGVCPSALMVSLVKLSFGFYFRGVCVYGGRLHVYLGGKLSVFIYLFFFGGGWGGWGGQFTCVTDYLSLPFIPSVLRCWACPIRPWTPLFTAASARVNTRPTPPRESRSSCSCPFTLYLFLSLFFSLFLSCRRLFVPHFCFLLAVLPSFLIFVLALVSPKASALQRVMTSVLDRIPKSNFLVLL